MTKTEQLKATLEVSNSPRWDHESGKWQHRGTQISVEARTMLDLAQEIAPFRAHCEVVEGPEGLIELLQAPPQHVPTRVQCCNMRLLKREQKRTPRTEKPTPKWEFRCPYDGRLFRQEDDLADHLYKAHGELAPEGLDLHDREQVKAWAREASSFGTPAGEVPEVKLELKPSTTDAADELLLTAFREGLTKGKAITRVAEEAGRKKSDILVRFRELVDQKQIVKVEGRWVAVE